LLGQLAKGMNQIFTTSGGPADCRSERTRPGGSCAWMLAIANVLEV
jgi:hypothetical protein